MQYGRPYFDAVPLLPLNSWRKRCAQQQQRRRILSVCARFLLKGKMAIFPLAFSWMTSALGTAVTPFLLLLLSPHSSIDNTRIKRTKVDTHTFSFEIFRPFYCLRIQTVPFPSPPSFTSFGHLTVLCCYLRLQGESTKFLAISKQRVIISFVLFSFQTVDYSISERTLNKQSLRRHSSSSSSSPSLRSSWRLEL